MRKMTSEHLNETEGKGDARKLCNEIRSIEASQWYDSRNQAKRVGAGQGGAGGTGARWCDKCQSSSHSTEKCWGRCGTCNKFGHPTDRCWENPANGKPQGAAGAAKTVQVPSTLEPIPPTGPTPEEIAAKKAKQKEKNKRLALKRKEKKAKKKKEAEEAKSAADTGRQTPPLPPLTASSSSEEDSPRKSPVRSRTFRVLGNTAKKSLHQKLNTISEDELEQLGEEIERC